MGVLLEKVFSSAGEMFCSNSQKRRARRQRGTEAERHGGREAQARHRTTGRAQARQRGTEAEIAALLQELLNGLKKAGFLGSAVLVVDDGDKLHLGALCGPEGQSAGNRAGDLIQALAPLVGGKGGGKPDMARGAGADRSRKEHLLAAARAEFQ